MGLCVPPDATFRLRFSQVNREMLRMIVIKPREKTPMRPFRCRDGSFRYGRMKKGRMNTKAVDHEFRYQMIADAWPFEIIPKISAERLNA